MKKIKRIKFVIDVEFTGPDKDNVFSQDDYPDYTKKCIKYMESWIRDSLYSPNYSVGFTHLGTSVRNGDEVVYQIKSIDVKGQEPHFQDVIK
jgi:hypothetical protein